MSLIKCLECGKEVSDKAPSCPNCGYPIAQATPLSSSLESLDENNYDEIIAELLSRNNNNKILTIKGLMRSTGMSMSDAKNKVDAFCSFSKSVSPLSCGIPTATKKVGPIQIDETHRMFRINGAVPINGKTDGLGKSMFKGMMAIGTMGMSVAAGKLIGGGKQKVGNKEWLDFSDLLNYELLEDDSLVTSGGVGQALIGGAIFGGFGAVAGGITGKRVQKKKIESLYIKATVNNFSSPCIMIPLITKSTKTNSKEYQTAFNLAHQILSAFDVITHNK